MPRRKYEPDYKLSPEEEKYPASVWWLSNHPMNREMDDLEAACRDLKEGRPKSKIK